MFSKKATKIEEIFTVNLTLCSKFQIDGEDFVKFCGLLRKHKLYQNVLATAMNCSKVWILDNWLGGSFKGWQTGQSYAKQFFQWQSICQDDRQWSIEHDFPDWHDITWIYTVLIVRQWGRGHWKKKKVIILHFCFP